MALDLLTLSQRPRLTDHYTTIQKKISLSKTPRLSNEPSKRKGKTDKWGNPGAGDGLLSNNQPHV